MQGIIYWLISLIPGFLILFIVYKLDVIEKEPKLTLLFLLLSGCFSYLVVKYITYLFEDFSPFITNYDYDEFSVMLIAFAVIAFIEEFSKYLVLNIFTWKNKKFNEVYDGILYGVFISLGFAIVENYFYLIDSDVSTLITRCIFSVPAHACFGIIMGYYYGYAKYYKSIDFTWGRYLYNKYCGFFIAMILHGVYDYILSSTFEYKLYAFIAYMFFMVIFIMLKIWELVKYKIKFGMKET